MKACTHRFASSLQRIADFLYEQGNINHPDVVYMNFTPDTGIFEDKATGSHLYLEFAGPKAENVSQILFCLEGEDGIVHRWVRKFQDEFGAIVDEIGQPEH